jgi:hypothetical protein
MMKIRRKDDNLGLDTIKALIAALMISLILFTITARRENEDSGLPGILSMEEETR